MSDISTKYNSLSPDLQKEVNDFMDFMLSKYKGKKVFDMKSWKKKVKNISKWTEDDIKAFEETSHQFDKWKAEEW